MCTIQKKKNKTHDDFYKEQRNNKYLAPEKTHSQQVHTKILNISNDQRMQIKAIMRYHLTPVRMASSSRQDIKIVGKSIEKKES